MRFYGSCQGRSQIHSRAILPLVNLRLESYESKTRSLRSHCFEMHFSGSLPPPQFFGRLSDLTVMVNINGLISCDVCLTQRSFHQDSYLDYPFTSGAMDNTDPFSPVPWISEGGAFRLGRTHSDLLCERGLGGVELLTSEAGLGKDSSTPADKDADEQSFHTGVDLMMGEEGVVKSGIHGDQGLQKVKVVCNNNLL